MASWYDILNSFSFQPNKEARDRMEWEKNIGEVVIEPWFGYPGGYDAYMEDQKKKKGLPEQTSPIPTTPTKITPPPITTAPTTQPMRYRPPNTTREAPIWNQTPSWIKAPGWLKKPRNLFGI